MHGQQNTTKKKFSGVINTSEIFCF